MVVRAVLGPAEAVACVANTCSPRLASVRREDLDDVWKIENLRRSLAMLTPVRRACWLLQCPD